jgi:hypothetical protein
LAKPGESGREWLDLGLPTIGERGLLAKRVREFLKSQELLLERISPHNLLKKTLREDEQEKPVAEIAEAFLRYPQLPMVESVAVIERAISQGVHDDVFAVKIGERVYYRESPPALTAEAVLVRKELVPQALAVAEPPPQALQATPPMPPKAGVEVPLSAASLPEGRGHRLKLRVKVPWDKLSDFVRGVILPLRNDGAELEVEVYLQAQSECGGIKPTTLEHKVNDPRLKSGACS